MRALHRTAGVVEEFRAFFLVGPVYFILFLVLRLYRLGLVYSYMPHLAIWAQPAYTAIFFTARVAALVYWGVVMRSASYLLSEPRLYTYESVKKLTR